MKFDAKWGWSKNQRRNSPTDGINTTIVKVRSGLLPFFLRRRSVRAAITAEMVEKIMPIVAEKTLDALWIGITGEVFIIAFSTHLSNASTMAGTLPWYDVPL